MAKNEARRARLVDAALCVLAKEGSRGLTHRAVDREAGVPLGTCGNYFSDRHGLFAAAGVRIFERLTPVGSALEVAAEAEAGVADPPGARRTGKVAGKVAGKARLVALMHGLVQRVMRQPDLQLALLELRLESARNGALRSTLTQTLRTAFELDVGFHGEARLPGGRDEVIMLHLAFEGLILNLVTVPGALEVAGRPELIEAMVERLVP